MQIFSHPVYASTGGWQTTGYNLYKSPANGNTICNTAVVAPGAVTITPASMANIYVGYNLLVDPGTLQEETVTVSSVTSTTFTATFANTHTSGFTAISEVLSPNWFGPWTLVSGYQNYTSNLDIYDKNGSKYDLYRVQPIVSLGANTGIKLDMSRPFYATTPLYDSQVSALIDYFRRAYLDDVGNDCIDSTIPTESTGMGTLPFITDASTDRFNLSFMPNEDPIKIVVEDGPMGPRLQVFQGASRSVAAPMVPYRDFYGSPDAGFIQFKSVPPTNNYLRVEYTKVRYTNDEIRKTLINAVSALSLYGINGFQVNNSNNLYYMPMSIPNRDLAEVICAIAAKVILGAKVLSSFEAAEAWKDGKGVEYTADPSRSIQAATLHIKNIEEELRHKASAYILQTRSYVTRGEFDSFFDTTGLLPVYTLFISNYNAFGWWL